MTERWYLIKGFGGNYEASNLGRIRSLLWSEPKILKGSLDARGYIHHTISGNKRIAAHRTVLQAIKPRRDLHRGIFACHRDNNPSNNRIDNLFWGTPADNNRHMVKCGHQVKGSRVAGALLTENKVREIRKLAKRGFSLQQIAERFGISRSTPHKILIGKNWRHIK